MDTNEQDKIQNKRKLDFGYEYVIRLENVNEILRQIYIPFKNSEFVFKIVFVFCLFSFVLERISPGSTRTGV